MDKIQRYMKGLGRKRRATLFSIVAVAFVLSMGSLLYLGAHVLSGMPLTTAAIPFGILAPIAFASYIVLSAVYKTHYT